ncbi:hypothetical protein SAMN05192551_10563 [Tindallia magadiensis]|uniref:Permease n=1 Tax=Tindallia magadiensis TaxID=69895 RepID=A0A1I3EM39_9FIRM|nr:efflux transporter SaoE [Tindallia magadiensis]SFH99923.1 hypothetical protein SAMN05192551_10563 [Tindallia magadiensis]
MLPSFIKEVLLVSIDLLNGASVWLVLSFLIAGMLHHFMSPAKLHQMLGNTKISSIVRATVSGMFLPICSCGVIPLGMSLYYSGAYVGPTIAFNIAAPIINPASLILAFGLLGPEIAVIYLIAGFTVPIIVGILGNWLAGPELHLPGMETCGEENRVLLEAEEEESFLQKLKGGIHWGFADMGAQVSKYVVPAMILVALLFMAVPPQFIQQYLGAPGVISIGGIALLASVMYVCAVGHIPFVAALLASGASPGVALTFLMAGTATNLPELISMYKLIGKRSVTIYAVSLFTCALLVGSITNALLLPGFTPVFDLARNQQTIDWAGFFIFAPPLVLRYIASGIIIALALKVYGENITRWMNQRRETACHENS